MLQKVSMDLWPPWVGSDEQSGLLWFSTTDSGEKETDHTYAPKQLKQGEGHPLCDSRVESQ